MGDWQYGDIVRRMRKVNPPVYQFVMYVGPGKGGYQTFSGIRLTPAEPLVQAGTMGKIMHRSLFEKVPEGEL